MDAPALETLRAGAARNGWAVTPAAEAPGRYRIQRAPRPRPAVSLSNRTAFFGAGHTNMTADWLATQTNSDALLRRSLKTLINRSRELEINNEYASAFFGSAERNVVGSEGFTLQMRVKEPAPGAPGQFQHDRLANQLIEDAWHRWSEPEHCTTTRQLRRADFERLSLRAILRDGAPLIHLIEGRTADNPFAFRLHLYEIDHLDPEHDERLDDRRQIRMGIEIETATNRPLAYWLLTDHPGDTYPTRRFRGKRRVRIPAGELLHPYLLTRIGQLRGMPALAAAMLNLRMLGGYREAELMQARLAATKGGFFTSTGTTPPPEYGGPGGDDGDTFPTEAAPGVFEHLPPGYDFKSYDPNYPNQDSAAFIKASLRGLAASVGCSYNALGQDYESVNYSSARVSMLEEREQWRLLQSWFATAVLQPIFRRWLRMSLAAGAIGGADGRRPLPLTRYDKFAAAHFRGRRWTWVDPAKEIQAITQELALGLTTPQRVLADRTGNNDLADIAEEWREAEALGFLRPTLSGSSGISTDGTDTAPIDTPAPTETP